MMRLRTVWECLLISMGRLRVFYYWLTRYWLAGVWELGTRI